MAIIIEIRPRIQVCNVFITMQKIVNIEKVVKITIKSSLIEMKYIHNTKTVSKNLSLEGCNLVPNSLSALKVKANSITFRLQMNPTNNITGSFSTEILHYSEMKRNFAEFVPSITPDEPCQISCKCCSKSISTGEVNFQRVLPLPSTTWEDGDWFCHRHSDTPAVESSPCVAKTNCLYGTCFILVPATVLCLPSPSDGGTIRRCARCRSWLGTFQKGKVKLWNCNVVFDTHDISEPNTAMQDFETVVRAAIFDSVGMMSRLLLETRVTEHETQYLLLWVMDKDLKLLINFDSDFSLDSPESKLKSVDSIKVLYLHQSEKTALVEHWSSDVNVQSIDVAKQMFVAGLEHLVKVTQYIPAESRFSNNFYVSYLGLGT